VYKQTIEWRQLLKSQWVRSRSRICHAAVDVPSKTAVPAGLVTAAATVRLSYM
jgi:hypothetical protein